MFGLFKDEDASYHIWLFSHDGKFLGRLTKSPVKRKFAKEFKEEYDNNPFGTYVYYGLIDDEQFFVQRRDDE